MRLRVRAAPRVFTLTRGGRPSAPQMPRSRGWCRYPTTALAIVTVLGACGLERGSDAPVELAAITFDTIAVVGAVDGDTATVFGRISKVVPIGDDRFAVIDQPRNRVSVYDYSGRLVSTVHAAGQGPGELGRPVDVMEGRDPEAITILDSGNGRLSSYDISRPEAAFIGQRMDPTARSQGMCRVSDEVILYSDWNDSVLHTLASDEAASSFVRSYGASPPMDALDHLGALGAVAEGQLRSARLACDADKELVIFGILGSPAVRAYDIDGELAWETQLVGIQPPRFIVSNLGGIGEDPEAVAHLLAGATVWSDELLLLQYMERRPGGPRTGDAVPILSRFLRLDTGEDLGQTYVLPRVAAAGPEFVLGVREEPAPQVLVLKRSDVRMIQR